MDDEALKLLHEGSVADDRQVQGGTSGARGRDLLRERLDEPLDAFALNEVADEEPAVASAGGLVAER